MVKREKNAAEPTLSDHLSRTDIVKASGDGHISIDQYDWSDESAVSSPSSSIHHLLNRTWGRKRGRRPVRM
jgi:hypothetical protein